MLLNSINYSHIKVTPIINEIQTSFVRIVHIGSAVQGRMYICQFDFESEISLGRCKISHTFPHPFPRSLPSLKSGIMKAGQEL
jgi:hypothetical protein